MPLESLGTLPEKELKSGMAEVIKTAILSGDDSFFEALAAYGKNKDTGALLACIEKAVAYKGKIVTEDPRESGKRMLLNLGHTFGHALEAACGLGKITHGEAVAWGITKACDLGLELQITPAERADKIKSLINSFGYDFGSMQKAASSPAFFDALTSDKKKKHGKFNFVIPDEQSARIIAIDGSEFDTIKKILKNGI
jgi:3-dehydroquinate synthase